MSIPLCSTSFQLQGHCLLHNQAPTRLKLETSSLSPVPVKDLSMAMAVPAHISAATWVNIVFLVKDAELLAPRLLSANIYHTCENARRVVETKAGDQLWHAYPVLRRMAWWGPWTSYRTVLSPRGGCPLAMATYAALWNSVCSGAVSSWKGGHFILLHGKSSPAVLFCVFDQRRNSWVNRASLYCR